MLFLTIVIESLQLNMRFNYNLRVVIEIDGKQCTPDKEIFLIKGKTQKQQNISINLNEFYQIKRLEDFKSKLVKIGIKQIKINFFTVSISDCHSQIRFHSQKIAVYEIVRAKKLVKKSLEDYYGSDAFIEFVIQINQKYNRNQKSGQQNEKLSNNEYQIKVASPTILRKKQTLQNYNSSGNLFTKSSFKLQSNSFHYTTQKLMKDVEIPINDTKRQRPSLTRMRSFEFDKRDFFNCDSHSNISQKTFKIQRKDRHIQQISRQKSILKQKKHELDNMVRNLKSKIQNLQNQIQKLQSKNVQNDKQLKKTLKDKREINQQKRKIQYLIETKDKKLIQLQRKLQALNESSKKKQTTYIQQLRATVNKLAEIGNEKQILQFQIQKLKKLVEEKQTTIKNAIKKPSVKNQQTEKEQVIDFKKKNLQLQKENMQERSANSALKVQNNSLLARIKGLNNELNLKKNGQQNYKDLIARQRFQIKRLEEQILLLRLVKKQNVKSCQKIEQDKKLMENTQQQINLKQIQIKKQNKVILTLQQQIQKLIQQNESLKNTINVKTRQFSKINMQNQHLLKESKTLAQKFIKLNNEFQRKESNLYSDKTEYIANKEKLINQISQLKKQLIQKQDQTKQLKLQLTKNKGQIKKALKSLSEQRQSHFKQIIKLGENNKIQLQKIVDLNENKWKRKVQQVKIENQIKFKSQIQNITQQCSEKQRNLIFSNDQISKKLNETLNETSKKTQKEIQAMKQNIQEKQNQVQLLSKQMSEKDQIISLMVKRQKQFENQNAQTYELKCKVDQQMEQRCHELEKLMERKEQQISEMTENFDQLQKINEKLQNQLILQLEQLKKRDEQNRLVCQKMKQTSKKLQQFEEKYIQAIQLQAQFKLKQAQLSQIVNPNQKQLETKVQQLEKIIDQKGKAIENIEKEIKALRQKQVKLVELAKNQLTSHCKGDKKKLLEALQKFEKVRKGIKVSNQNVTLGIQTQKKMSSLQTQLQDQKQIALTNYTQLKSKQIEIQTLKVKYNKYKEQNQKLVSQIESMKKQTKKSAVKLQNIVIALGQTKKQTAQLEDQISAKGMTWGGSTKIGTAFVLLKQSVRKVEAVAISSGTGNFKHTQNLLELSVIGLNSPGKPSSNKLSMINQNQDLDSKSVINFNPKKASRQVLKPKKSIKQSMQFNQLRIPPSVKRQSQNVQKFLNQQLQVQDLNQSMVSTHSAILPSSGKSKNKQSSKQNNKMLCVDSSKDDMKSNLSNSMMISPRQLKEQQSFFDRSKSDVESSASMSLNNPHKLVLNESLLCDNPSKKQTQKYGQNSKDDDPFDLKDLNTSQIKKGNHLIGIDNQQDEDLNGIPQIKIQFSKPKQYLQEIDQKDIQKGISMKRIGQTRTLSPIPIISHDFSFV